jgi:acyl carrier protein
MSNPRDVERRVEELFRELFGLHAAEASDDARRGDLPRWDSLGHLDLLVALRKEFAIDIPLDQALAMETVGDVKRIVAALVLERSASGKGAAR